MARSQAEALAGGVADERAVRAGDISLHFMKKAVIAVLLEES
jgi:hypothetical protein